MTINYNIQLLVRDAKERIHIINKLKQIKEEYKIDNCNILELGCGLGQNLVIFADSNNVIGIDGLAEAVETARSLGITAVKEDLESILNIADNTQDWILCLDVLEHLVNATHLMKEIKRLLTINGKCIINVPNHFTLKSRLKILFGHNLDTYNYFPNQNEWDCPHVRFFTYTGIKRFIKQSGFEIDRDYSGDFTAFPKASYFRKMGLGGLIKRIAAIKPALFASGFFFIIVKKDR